MPETFKAAPRGASTKAPARNTKADVPTLRRATVDGVRTLWAPRPGPVVAMLRFRVGTADEALYTHGVTHVVEHLALSAAKRGDADFNGWVTLQTTTFVATGARAEVQRFLVDLGTALQALPLARLDDELKIQRTEAAQRQRGVVDHALLQRFGTTGYGLSWWEELGFDTLKPADVAAHAARYFTADNAVLLLSGQPRGFHVDLAAGEAHPLPQPDAISPLPGWVSAYDNTNVGASWLSGRGAAAGVFARSVDRRLTEALRHDQALVYSVNGSLERVGDELHSFVGSQALPEHAVEAAGAFRTVVEESLEESITRAELTADLKRAQKALAAANGDAMGWLNRAGDELLFNGEVTQPPEVVRSALSVTVDEVTAVAESVAETLLLFLPDGASIRGLTRAEPTVPVIAQKPTHTSKAFFNGKEVTTVDVGSEGINWRSKEQNFGYRWDDLTAWVAYDSPRRMLVHRTGRTLNLQAKRWSKQAALARAIDQHAPTHLRLTREDWHKDDDVPAPPMSLRALGNGVWSGLIGGVMVFVVAMLLYAIGDAATNPSGDSWIVVLLFLPIAAVFVSVFLRRITGSGPKELWQTFGPAGRKKKSGS